MLNLYPLLRFVWNHPLNASHRLAAIGRVFRWQLAVRMMSGPIAFPFVENTRLFAMRGMTGATGNWYCGLHEANDMAFVLHLLRAGEHFLDVGANVGSYSVLAASVPARVTAVEPIPETFEHLARNVALNGLAEQVRIWQMGLSDRASKLRFTTGLDCVNHVLASGEDSPSVEVPVTTLDELVGPDVPVLIKIDVEGHECSVLRGAVRTLSDSRLQAVIMETNGSGARYGVVDEELVSIMLEHGFSPYSYDPFNRTLVEKEVSEGNTVFVRDPENVAKRVQGARRFKLINGEI